MSRFSLKAVLLVPYWTRSILPLSLALIVSVTVTFCSLYSLNVALLLLLFLSCVLRFLSTFFVVRQMTSHLPALADSGKLMDSKEILLGFAFPFIFSLVALYHEFVMPNCVAASALGFSEYFMLMWWSAGLFGLGSSFAGAFFSSWQVITKSKPKPDPFWDEHFRELILGSHWPELLSYYEENVGVSNKSEQSGGV